MAAAAEPTPTRSSRPRRLLASALTLVAVCAVGEVVGPQPARFDALPPGGGEAQALLVAVPLPPPLTFAVHPWFLVFEPADGAWHRWEVWQDADGPWGHVQKDLMCPSDPSEMDGGPPHVLARWSGPEAARLGATLARESPRYRFRDRYLAFPGPNSNTYVAEMLRLAEVEVDLPASMIGRRWRGPLGFGAGAPPSGLGLALETPALGLSLGVREGLEVQLLGLPFGIDPWPLALRVPVGDGRIGW
jgi:hypothetical protein